MRRTRRGLTLVELLVALSIISLLAAILMPALGKARRQARLMLGMTNQRQIVRGVTGFALDHHDRYPDSVATVGVVGGWWNWQEPTMLIGYRARSPRLHRSMSAYLREYIEDAKIMFCPNAPREYPYLQEAWDQGNRWDHPETPPVQDPLTGTYCFYWGYTGYLEGRINPFKGPRSLAGGSRQSKLLVSDYFGYDHWRSPGAYGSCEKFRRAWVTPGTWVSSTYWSCSDSGGALKPESLDVELHAGYTDGHVEKFSVSKVITMKVSITSDGSTPYPDGVGPGDFYLPSNSTGH